MCIITVDDDVYQHIKHNAAGYMKETATKLSSGWYDVPIDKGLLMYLTMHAFDEGCTDINSYLRIRFNLGSVIPH